MKLKFRAEHKDFVAYAWACLLLLVVVALCVVNIYHVTTSNLELEDNHIGFTFNFIILLFLPFILNTIFGWFGLPLCL